MNLITLKLAENQNLKYLA